ncbi:unnamed protein product [Clonostachys byssicola]|uniref:Uncharacterized protein n=1 Tax=Clonostachys byssicola TaxID=160290 RepID=A0A9N9U989_9HYPO|nr:unnamed protein product [Clonostachys byssicola]
MPVGVAHLPVYDKEYVVTYIQIAPGRINLSRSIDQRCDSGGGEEDVPHYRMTNSPREKHGCVM